MANRKAKKPVSDANKESVRTRNPYVVPRQPIYQDPENGLDPELLVAVAFFGSCGHLGVTWLSKPREDHEEDFLRACRYWGDGTHLCPNCDLNP